MNLKWEFGCFSKGQGITLLPGFHLVGSIEGSLCTHSFKILYTPITSFRIPAFNSRGMIFIVYRFDTFF